MESRVRNPTGPHKRLCALVRVKSKGQSGVKLLWRQIQTEWTPSKQVSCILKEWPYDIIRLKISLLEKKAHGIFVWEVLKVLTSRCIHTAWFVCPSISVPQPLRALPNLCIRTQSAFQFDFTWRAAPYVFRYLARKDRQLIPLQMSGVSSQKWNFFC